MLILGTYTSSEKNQFPSLLLNEEKGAANGESGNKKKKEKQLTSTFPPNINR